MDIEFFHPSEVVVENFPPLPAKKMIPKWFKNCPVENNGEPTIKNCPPVTDMVTSGYIIRSPFEYDLQSFINENGIEDIRHRAPNEHCLHYHDYVQFPIPHDKKQKNYFKFNHGWIIKTPPGYSCLIIQPFYNLESRFKLLPAIVDTDKYDASIEFPGYTLTDDLIHVQPGDPLMQVIPFKREEWQMKTDIHRKGTIMDLFIYRPFSKMYKTFVQSKKTYK